MILSVSSVMSSPPRFLATNEIQRRIHLIRGQRVLLDSDLAEFYGVPTSHLNKAIARNRARFPADFAVRLTMDETKALIFQSGISKPVRGGVRKPATVFTEQGVAMLASVLRSPRAIAVSVAIIRVFVQLRHLLSTHRELANKLAELERRLEGHDAAIVDLFTTLRQLLPPAEPAQRRKIGFRPESE
jgi:hypothetical protein